MKIGIDARYLENEITGLGRYSYNLLQNVLQIDRENHYHVFLRKNYHGVLPHSPNITYHHVPFMPISLSTIFLMGIYTRVQRLDIFHSHFPVAPLFPAARSIVTVHDLQPLRVPSLGARRAWPLQISYKIYYSLFYRITLFRAKAIIAVSNATRWDLEDLLGIPRERIHVVHESIDERFRDSHTSIDLHTIRSRYHLPEVFLLYIGATLPHKNLPNLLKGYKQALESGRMEGVSLILVGRKSRFELELQQLINNLDIKNQVQMIGYVPQEDLPALYTMAKALLHVTRYEGFGFPPLEAIHHELPVLAAYHASLPEVVGACGLFVNPYDIEGIAGAILSIVHNPTLRNRLVAIGKNHLTRFSWQKAAKETIRIYEEVYMQ